MYLLQVDPPGQTQPGRGERAGSPPLPITAPCYRALVSANASKPRSQISCSSLAGFPRVVPSVCSPPRPLSPLLLPALSPLTLSILSQPAPARRSAESAYPSPFLFCASTYMEKPL